MIFSVVRDVENPFFLPVQLIESYQNNMDRVKRIWYLSPMRVGKVQASLRIHAVSPEPSLLAHTSSESRGTFRQKARSLAPLNGWACAIKICHDGMLEDTNSLNGAHMFEDNIRLQGQVIADWSAINVAIKLEHLEQNKRPGMTNEDGPWCKVMVI